MIPKKTWSQKSRDLGPLNFQGAAVRKQVLLITAHYKQKSRMAEESADG